ncbi:MAG: hypothetical protein HY567_02045 [Candidatus Kerfeldbacteria bacterium]|nr:hypothetical protein [Candidatus Kerfeldbacteria bacterium]
MAINWKRLLLVLGFLLVTIGIGVTIYFVFFRNIFGPPAANQNINGVIFPLANENRNAGVGPANVNALPNVNAAVGQPRPVADGGPTQVVPIVSTLPGGATLANNGRDLLYYDPRTGKFYQISPDGRTRTELTPDRYPAADKVTWAPLRDKAAIEFPDGSKFIYDFRQQKQYTLAPEMEEITFSPTGDKISFKFIGDDPADRLLVTANFDGTGATTIEPLADKADQFDVNWSPLGNVVATFRESIDADRQRVIPIGLLGENFSSFNVPGRGFQHIWSTDGSNILFSVFRKDTGYNPNLYIASGRTESLGNNMINLDLQTWPDKCVFGSAAALFCAVPQYLEQGTGLFPNLASEVPDDFYRIDLATGQKQLIARPVNADGESSYTASQLILSADETVLYFFDQRTNQVQKIQLK